MEEDRLCLWCKHFDFYMGSPGYSEYTPGEDASFECAKNHWKMLNYNIGREEFVNHIESGKKCPDFERREEQ